MVAAPASAQMNHGSDASLAGVRGLYETARGYILASAEKMPEADYAYKPVASVRSFGQLLGHVANASFAFCAGAMGEKAPTMPDAEKHESKAALITALKGGFAYCDKAYQLDAMKAGESMEFFGQKHTRLSVLAFNVAHDFEHYGNLVTYMRMKGMVPPSSMQGGGN
ncbi:MAG: DinB family protein [Gemmatimonadaceae bacterium]